MYQRNFMKSSGDGGVSGSGRRRVNVSGGGHSWVRTGADREDAGHANNGQ
ncbi:MAG: hypothetical protein ACP5NN_09690 [Methanolinea sp.]